MKSVYLYSNFVCMRAPSRSSIEHWKVQFDFLQVYCTINTHTQISYAHVPVYGAFFWLTHTKQNY